MVFDILIVALMILFFVVGLNKGLIRSLYSMLSLVISVVVVHFFLDSFVDVMAKSPIGISVGGFFAANTNEIIAKQCASAVISALSVILLYFLVRIVLRVIINALDFVAKLPILSTLNKLLGGVCGLFTGALWVLFITNVGYYFPQVRPLIEDSSIVESLGILFVTI